MSKEINKVKGNIKYFQDQIKDNKQWREKAAAALDQLEELQHVARYTVFWSWIVTSFLEKHINRTIEWRDRCDSAIKNNEYELLKLRVKLLELQGKK